MWCNYLNLPKNDNLKGGGVGVDDNLVFLNTLGPHAKKIQRYRQHIVQIRRLIELALEKLVFVSCTLL